MLLEVLSDFQISIPELGRDRGAHAPDRPAHLEQLARADRGAEAPLPVPVARLPGASSASWRSCACTRPSSPSRSRAGWSRSIAHGPRSSTSRSRPRSPSRSTGRARCCCSAPTTSTARPFAQTMSIIVKHRTDIDLVAERVGVKLGGAASAERREPPAPARPASAPPGPPGWRRGCSRFCEELRGEGVAVGTSEILDAFAALDAGAAGPRRTTSARRSRRRSPSRRRTGASSSSSSTASSSAPPRPRRSSAGIGEERARYDGRRAARPRRAARADPPGDRRRATTARCATSRGWRSPPSAARARARA